MMTASFPRRAAAGLIDTAICFGLSVVFAIGWLYWNFGLCDGCTTAEELQDFILIATLAADKLAPVFFALPAGLYFLWSWTPLAGHRSIGMRAMRIHAMATRRNTQQSMAAAR